MPRGVTLFDAASWNGIAIDSTCGGHGTCKKCRIRFKSDPPLPTSLDLRAYTAQEIKDGWRLACRTPATTDADIEVPPLTTRPKAATVGVGRQVILRPAVLKRFLELAEPTLTDQLTDLERVLAAAPAAGVPAQAASGAGTRMRVSGAGNAEHESVLDEAQAPRAGGATPAGGTLVPHTPMRRAIARRLTESKASVPHFYLTAEPVVDELLALRSRVNEASAVKVSVNDFVIAAVAAAFGDVPEANVTWSDEGLVTYRSVDISIAVATDGGLVTPVLRGAERMRLSAIARESAALAQRARDRRLLQHELAGGTFAVSNLGMYGTVEFSAIINPPQSAILAVGAARQQPVAVDGALSVATVMRCTLSVDHRAIDGALAARWLAAFTARMENPLGALI